jgi:biopolymer transport protein ExbB/TolQ
MLFFDKYKYIFIIAMLLFIICILFYILYKNKQLYILIEQNNQLYKQKQQKIMNIPKKATQCPKQNVLFEPLFNMQSFIPNMQPIFTNTNNSKAKVEELKEPEETEEQLISSLDNEMDQQPENVSELDLDLELKDEINELNEEEE